MLSENYMGSTPTSPGGESAASAPPGLITTILPSNGQVLVEETDELLTTSLAALREYLVQTPAWGGAPAPTDEFLLMFLRAEVFSAEKAAVRYRKFWEVKISIWGEDKAALPVKALDAMAGLETQVMQIVPGAKDIEGRQIIFVNTANVNKKVDRVSRVRAVWYMMFAALEDVETQRKGVCLVVTFKNARITQIDHKYNKIAVEMIQGALPVRIGSQNMCHPPPFFRAFWMIFRSFMSRNVRRRVRFAVGTDAQIVKALGVIVAPENVPHPIGPKEVDFKAWLAERVRSEA